MPRPQAPWVKPGRILARALRAADPAITRNEIAKRLSADIPNVPIATHTRRVILGWEEEGSLPEALKTSAGNLHPGGGLARSHKSPT